MTQDLRLTEGMTPADLAVSDHPRAGRLIRIGARLGVWGFTGALASLTAVSLGSGPPPGFTIPIVGLGMVLSGVGTTLASLLIYPRAPRGPVKVAAVTGAPLGVGLTLFGVAILTQRALLAIMGVTSALGIVFLVSLVVGFFLHWREEEAARGNAR